MNGALAWPIASSRQRGGILAKLIVLIALVIFCVLIYLVRAPLLRVAGGFWIVSDHPANCDAIVILSDDNFTADRAARAAELYHDGWAPRVVCSGRRLRPYFGIAQLEQRDLEIRGVPAKAAIPLAHNAPDTLEELKGIRDFLAPRGWKRVMIVTSNYHTRRTRYLCRHIFPSDFHVLVVTAPDHDYDPDSWWRTRGGLKIFFHESVGMVVAFWEVHHENMKSPQSTADAFAMEGAKASSQLEQAALQLDLTYKQRPVVHFENTTCISAWFISPGLCTIVLALQNHSWFGEARPSHRVGGFHVAETTGSEALFSCDASSVRLRQSEPKTVRAFRAVANFVRAASTSAAL
jgi:uncharacterized SAM-binding protein YcdF (DUF218 family)